MTWLSTWQSPIGVQYEDHGENEAAAKAHSEAQGRLRMQSTWFWISDEETA